MTDPCLSLCTPATRGVWIDLLCAIHKLDRSGELCGTPEQLARIARCRTEEIADALTELRTTGTADVTERNGIVYVLSRRMKRDAKLREQWRIQKINQRSPQNVRQVSGRSPPVSSSSSSIHKPPISPFKGKKTDKTRTSAPETPKDWTAKEWKIFERENGKEKMEELKKKYGVKK